jgi:fumarylacetoacetate (FAA) hydrolase
MSERHLIEIIDQGDARTPFMRFGDRVRMAATDAAGGVPFGVVDLQIVRSTPD